jgi:hypothetical protein
VLHVCGPLAGVTGRTCNQVTANNTLSAAAACLSQMMVPGCKVYSVLHQSVCGATRWWRFNKPGVVLAALLQIGWICQTVVVFGVPYDPETYFAPSGVGRTFFWIFALLPWCPLSKGTQDLAAATNSDKSPGMVGMQPPCYLCLLPYTSQFALR